MCNNMHSQSSMQTEQSSGLSSQDPGPTKVTLRHWWWRQANDDSNTLIMVPSNSCDSGECIKWDTRAVWLIQTPYFQLMRV